MKQYTLNDFAGFNSRPLKQNRPAPGGTKRLQARHQVRWCRLQFPGLEDIMQDRQRHGVEALEPAAG